MRAVERVTLQGTDVQLVPVSATHAPPLFRGSHGSPQAEDIWAYMGYGPFQSEASMREWLSSLEASTDPLFLTVIDSRSRDPLGLASFLNIDLVMRRLEVGHLWYVVEAQRTTANTEVVFLMAAHAFEELGARRLEWKCDALNVRSRQAAERLGFVFEGILRNHMIVKGRNRDTAYYSLIDSEWGEVGDLLRAWLYDVDRDANNRPAASLAEMMRQARGLIAAPTSQRNGSKKPNANST